MIKRLIFLTYLTILVSTQATFGQLLSEDALENEKKYIYLKDALKKPNKVKVLSLWFLDLKEIPQELTQLKHLQKLEINHNQIKEIPAFLGDLSDLQVLNFEHNQLSHLPKELFQLRHLFRLDCHSNQIQEIPEDIAALTQLKYLDFHNNKIQKLPEGLKALQNLKWINIKENPLASGELEKLRKWLPNAKIYADE